MKNLHIRKIFWGNICLSVLIVLTSFVIPAFSQESPSAGNYIIGAEDVLDIRVWGHEDLTRTVTVSADGYFSFPLIGQIKAGGLTVRSLEDTIAKLGGILAGAYHRPNPPVDEIRDQAILLVPIHAILLPSPHNIPPGGMFAQL